MLKIREINGKEVAIETSKASSIFLKQEDLAISGIDITKCSLNDIEKYLKGNTDVVPFELTWELTSRCNLDCKFCYIHNHTSYKDITFEKVKPYIDEMISKGLIRVTLTGGECTLNKDFLKIYQYFKENGVLVDVYTNGILLNDDIFEVFAKYPPNRVEMTIYNSYENEPRPYLNALKLKENKINVLIKFTVATTTIQYFEFVRNWCQENKFSFKFDTDITDAYDNSNTSVYQVRLEEKVKLDRIRAQQKNESKKMLCFNCGAGNVSYHINSHFELGLCSRDSERYSLSETTFESAYNQMVQKILRFKNKKFINCTNCFAKSICRMCYLRCEKSVDKDGQDTVKAPLSFCKATQEYYKKLFTE